MTASVEYVVRGRLAIGGMAELMEAALTDGTDVVAKRLLPQYADNSECIEMLEHEILLGQLLSHIGVVRCLGRGKSEKGELVAIFDRVPGASLDVVLDSIIAEGKRGKLARVMAVAQGAADALDYVHHASNDVGESLGIVHRDICPGNIMVDDRSVVLIDFGIAQSTRYAGTSTVKGRAAYMSPEQAKGQEVDHRADIFALGVVLFELATGHRYYGSGDKLKVMAGIAEGAHPRARDIWPGCPGALDELLYSATEPDAAKRLSSAGELSLAACAISESRGV